MENWAGACFSVAIYDLYFVGWLDTESFVTAAANGPVVADIDD
jgi:hypothetical protein